MLPHLFLFAPSILCSVERKKRKTETVRFSAKFIHNPYGRLFVFSLSKWTMWLKSRRKFGKPQIRTLEPLILYRTRVAGHTTQARHTDFKKSKDVSSFKYILAVFKITWKSKQDRSVYKGIVYYSSVISFFCFIIWFWDSLILIRVAVVHLFSLRNNILLLLIYLDFFFTIVLCTFCMSHFFYFFFPLHFYLLFDWDFFNFYFLFFEED